MAQYAIHNGIVIVNVIVADSQEIAEEATGLQAFETSGEPWIGWILQDGDWVSPYPVTDPTSGPLED